MQFFDQTIFVVSLVVAASSFFFSSIVFLKDRRNVVHRSFLGVGISIALWIVAVLIETRVGVEEIVLLGARTELAAASLFLFFIYRFSYHFGGPFRSFKERAALAGAASVTMSVLGIATPFVLEAARRTERGLMHEYGVLWWLIPLYITVFAGLCLSIIIVKFMRFSEKERKHTRLILAGMLVSAPVVLTTNFIMPFFYHKDTMQYGPLGIMFLTAFSSYAILRHRLFNVRVMAAEMIALVLLLFIVISIPFADSAVEISIDVFLLLVMSVASFFIVKSAIADIKQQEDLMRTADALEKANEKLERLDEVRKGFLSFVSHQLRQPLVIMKGYASLIREGEFGEATAEMKHASQKIYDATEELNLLISTFLDIRAIEEGKIQYSFKETDVARLVQDIVSEYRTIAKERGIELAFISDPRVIEADVDVLKFRQVVQNLIDNAVKYTKQGSVRVSLSEEDDRAVIRVEDTGVGIPEELQPHLFEQFARAKSATERGIRGTGLGLYFVKKIIEAHQGSVCVTSRGEGSGSSFVIKIPKIR